MVDKTKETEEREKVKVNKKEKAIKAIQKELDSKEIAYSEETIASICDGLYEKYETDETIPTREAFAEICEDKTIGDAVVAMEQDPFIKKSSKRRIVAIIVACVVIAALAGVGIGIVTNSDNAEAIANSDETLTDNNDEGIVVDDENEEEEIIEAETETAVETSKSSSSAKTGNTTSATSTSNSTSSTKSSTTSSNNTSSSSSSSKSSSSSSSSSGSSSSNSSSNHTHNWVAQTENVYHDAEYKYVVVCNHCGNYYDTVSEHADHAKQLLLNGEIQQENNLSYYTTYILTQQAYNEEIVTGYKCSTCGATKAA